MISTTTKKLIQIDCKTQKLVSFEDLLTQFEPLTNSLVAQWSKFDSDDIRQICYIGLWKAFKTFNIDKATSFGFYSKKIIINDIYYYARKNKQESLSLNAISIDDSDIEFINNVVDETSSLQIDNSTYQLFLNEYISFLPEKFQQLFNLYYVKRYNQNEIAILQNVTQPAVSYNLKQLIKYIKRIYEIDSVVEYVHCNIRDVIKKTYVLNNINTYIKECSLENIKSIAHYMQITINKIKTAQISINDNCLDWLIASYEKIDKYVEINIDIVAENSTYYINHQAMPKEEFEIIKLNILKFDV